jgi:hypothetical protein
MKRTRRHLNPATGCLEAAKPKTKELFQATIAPTCDDAQLARFAGHKARGTTPGNPTWYRPSIIKPFHFIADRAPIYPAHCHPTKHGDAVAAIDFPRNGKELWITTAAYVAQYDRRRSFVPVVYTPTSLPDYSLTELKEAA